MRFKPDYLRASISTGIASAILTLIIVFSSALFGGCSKDRSRSANTQAEKITIFAAASTNDCMTRLSINLNSEKHINCEISAASSGTLAQQIVRGAKPDIYISASRKWMKYLIDNNYADPSQTFAVASNRLVLVCPKRVYAEMACGEITEKLPQMLGNKDILAIGDPSHVPAGKYAKQALESLSVWKKLSGRMSFEPNVTAVLQKAVTGTAKFAIVYESDIQSITSVRKICVLDSSLHSPIEYYCSILNPDSKAAEEFVNYLFSPIGQRQVNLSGFIPQDKRYAFLTNTGN